MNTIMISCSCGKQGEKVYSCSICHPSKKESSGWQKCPICQGHGFIPSLFTNDTEKCEICNGEKIINKDQGTPPSKTIIL